MNCRNLNHAILKKVLNNTILKFQQPKITGIKRDNLTVFHIV